LRSRILLTILLLIIINTVIYGRGKKDDTLVQTQNNEWILCITAFDVSSLPPDKLHISGVVSREMVERLNAVSYRTRISPEYAYYEEAAWSKARSTAAKAISSKMEERSAALFRGDPAWMYRQNVKKIDADLEKLRANFEEIENNPPVINKEPVFSLKKENQTLAFPEAPAAGAERRFCASQSADAFLTGSIIDFYGRHMLSVRLYTAYTKSFVWEESTIFSQEDIDYAVSEIIRKLVIELTGNKPAIVEITTEPDDALVLINRSFAGRGGTETLELPPSTIIVTASAPNHESVAFETTLSADEITKIDINLTPINFADVNIEGETGGRVYQGALFSGFAPLSMSLPINHLEYIEMLGSNSQEGRIVFETPESIGFSPTFPVRTRQPLPQGRVDKDRRTYYWAWGATWITGIAFWIANHSYNDALRTYSSYPVDEKFMNKLNALYYLRISAIVGFATAGSYSLYRFIRYLVTADRGSTRIISPPKKAEQGGN